jgi:biotin operon repressor
MIDNTLDREIAEQIRMRLKTSMRWVKSPIIEKKMGLSGATVRAYVNFLRQLGHPIVSGGNGYKYAENAAEIDECLRHMYSRAKSIKEAATGLQKARRVMTGESIDEQIGLFDYIP